MLLNTVKKRLEAAVETVSSAEARSRFTSRTHQSEWNLCHQLARELEALFPRHDCDVDAIKVDAGSRRPDIILHRRGTNAHNLLVVEVKRSKSGVQDDIEKIKQFWMQPPLSYKFGAAVILDPRKPSITLLENPTWTKPS